MNIRDYLTKKIFPFLKFAKDEILEKEKKDKYTFYHKLYFRDENCPAIMEFTIILN